MVTGDNPMAPWTIKRHKQMVLTWFGREAPITNAVAKAAYTTNDSPFRRRACAFDWDSSIEASGFLFDTIVKIGCDREQS